MASASKKFRKWTPEQQADAAEEKRRREADLSAKKTVKEKKVQEQHADLQDLVGKKKKWGSSLERNSVI